MDLSQILSYDNITIVILFVMCLAQWRIIFKLLNGLLATKDILNNLSSVIAILNDRLSHKEPHDDVK